MALLSPIACYGAHDPPEAEAPPAGETPPPDEPDYGGCESAPVESPCDGLDCADGDAAAGGARHRARRARASRRPRSVRHGRRFDVGRRAQHERLNWLRTGWTNVAVDTTGGEAALRELVGLGFCLDPIEVMPYTELVAQAEACDPAVEWAPCTGSRWQSGEWIMDVTLGACDVMAVATERRAEDCYPTVAAIDLVHGVTLACEPVDVCSDDPTDGVGDPNPSSE